MNERLMSYVDELFADAPHTHQVADIKEEMTGNLQAKFDDLRAGGMDEETAFQNVVSGIGDIKSLLGNEQIQEVENARNKRQRSSLLKGLAVMLYILSAIPLIFFNEFVPELGALGIISCIGISAIATGILIFAASITPKKYRKGDDTFVEEYKEKVTGGDKQQRLRNAVSSTLWLLVVTIYLLISFISDQWHITWLIFLAGGLVQNMIMYVMGDPKRQKNLASSAIWTTAVICYFVISFTTGHWFWAAFIFLAAALIQQLIRLYRIWTEE